MKPLIYIVEDEIDIANLISLNFEQANINVKSANNSTELNKLLFNKLPDLIILDFMLPDKDGFETCKELKVKEKTKDIPIIFLTAKNNEFDRVLGLEIGADDYITKPFSVRELIARVKVILKRYNTNSTKHIIKEKILNLGNNIIIDISKFEVFVNSKKINLTVTEFKILTLFAKNPGIVFDRKAILDYLWGNSKIVLDRTIDVHIKHLREKLGEDGNLIKNIRGIGYKCDL